MNDAAPIGLSYGDTQRGFADGDTVVTFRRHLRAWLESTVDVSAERAGDIVLATEEALTNVVDHAYAGCDSVGHVALTVSHDAEGAAVHIRVSDEGRWLEPRRTDVDSPRGRGLVLMRMLAHACVIDGQDDGTSVWLTFADCPRREEVAALLG